MMDQALMVSESGVGVALVRRPEDVLADAQLAASALMKVVSAKKDKVTFNGEQYLENDDWQTIATFHGCTVDFVWTRPVQFQIGDKLVSGWEARAVLKDRTGRELSHAEAMCLNDEARWSSRPRYAFCYAKKSGGFSEEDPGADEILWEANPFKPGKSRPKKERVLVGEEVVPQFQLRSMAQTRASSKVISTVFRWVVQLAGYRGTPAEEMDGVIDRASDRASDDRPEPRSVGRSTSSPEPPSGRDEPPMVDPVTGEELPPRSAGPSSGDGSVTVENIVPKTWGADKRPMWETRFSDGRVATIFDEPLFKVADQAWKAGASVLATTEESRTAKGRFKVSALKLA